MGAPSDVDRWFEPIAEGMWKPDLLFEVPRHANWIHLLFALAWLIDTSFWIWIAAGTHFCMVIATFADPEWPRVLNDFFIEPNELEP